MAASAEQDRLAQIEESARRRFVRWDARLWERVVQGPARALATDLQDAGHARPHVEAVLDAYLRLAAEGIGLGYLVPEEAGAQTAATLLWMSLLPDGLPSLPAARQTDTLAACWNLAENLEAQPVWVRRAFVRALRGVRLDALEKVIADVARRLDARPSRRLGRRFAVQWVDLADEDRAFLPGAVHFAAPTVACVHDRLTASTENPASIGIWLDQDPLILGPLGCRESPPTDPGLRLDLMEVLGEQEPRAADAFAMAASEWLAVVTLSTSQRVVALFPR